MVAPGAEEALRRGAETHVGKAVSRGSWPHSAVLTMDASATHFKEQEAGCSLSGHHVPSEADGRDRAAARGLWPFRLPASVDSSQGRCPRRGGPAGAGGEPWGGPHGLGGLGGLGKGSRLSRLPHYLPVSFPWPTSHCSD